MVRALQILALLFVPGSWIAAAVYWLWIQARKGASHEDEVVRDPVCGGNAR